MRRAVQPVRRQTRSQCTVVVGPGLHAHCAHEVDPPAALAPDVHDIQHRAEPVLGRTDTGESDRWLVGCPAVRLLLAA